MADPRPQPIVVYLAHPVGAADAAGVESNLRHARTWLRWLIDLPNLATGRISWCAPWLAYVETLGDAPHYRERGLRDTIAVLERCDAIVAVGRLTPGVSTELGVATLVGQPSVNLVREGALPPTTARDRWWEAQPTAGIISELVELVAKVERKRDLQTTCTRPGGER